jgi:hypothetical protein
MDFETLVQTRKSVRGFKKTAGVPRRDRGDHRHGQTRAILDEHPALACPCPDRRAAGARPTAQQLRPLGISTVRDRVCMTATYRRGRRILGMLLVHGAETAKGIRTLIDRA